MGAAALGHNGLMEAGSEVVRKLVNLIVTVDFDGFLGGVHDDMAFVAPMQMLIQFSPKALADLAVKVIGQLL